MTPAPLLLKKRKHHKCRPPASSRKEQGLNTDDEVLVCLNCNAVVTTPADGISIAGRHEYTKTNPQGIVFQLGCFHDGHCLAIGEPTSEFSWFSGFTWQFALCAECRTHLGWYFSGTNSFWGLIYGKLKRVEMD